MVVPPRFQSGCSDKRKFDLILPRLKNKEVFLCFIYNSVDHNAAQMATQQTRAVKCFSENKRALNIYLFRWIVASWGESKRRCGLTEIPTCTFWMPNKIMLRVHRESLRQGMKLLFQLLSTFTYFLTRSSTGKGGKQNWSSAAGAYSHRSTLDA